MQYDFLIQRIECIMCMPLAEKQWVDSICNQLHKYSAYFDNNNDNNQQKHKQVISFTLLYCIIRIHNNHILDCYLKPLLREKEPFLSAHPIK